MKRVLILALALSACVAPTRREPPRVAPQPPTPRATPPSPVPPPVAWEDRSRTPGDWRYGQTPGGSIAIYGRDNDAIFAIACSSTPRRVALLVPSAVPQARMTVRTTSLSRTLNATAVPARDGARLGLSDPRPLAAAMLAPDDALLDAMIYSRGRFQLEAGGASLILPAWPEVNRVVEDCRG